MKILNFGSINIDYVYYLDHIVKAGETTMSQRFEIFPGGKGLNQSLAAAKAGANIFHAGCAGSDAKILTDILSESGVDLTYLKKVDQKNGHAIIQVGSTGQNSIFVYPGSNEMVSTKQIDAVLEDFSDGDMILLQNEISNVDYIIEKAHQKNMCIILNPSPFNEKMRAVDYQKLSYVILNEVEAKEISGVDLPEESLTYIKNRYPRLKVILTLGSKGCIYSDAERTLYQPAFEVKTVDTTAAGDTFTGYFIAELAKGTDVAEILKIASAASAIAVSVQGAAPSIPDRYTVIATLPQLREKDTKKQPNVLKKQIEDYFTEHLQTASLGELSEMLGYSSVYTGALIKKLIGKSFSKALQDQRCKLAAQSLTETDLPIDEIIRHVGYANESFFRKVFKEHYGMTPLEFRKRR